MRDKNKTDDKFLLIAGIIIISFYMIKLLDVNSEMWLRWYSLFSIIIGMICLWKS